MAGVSKHVNHHHVEKKAAIHKVLAGKSDLRIWEPNAYKDDGSLGEAAKAFADHSTPSKHVLDRWRGGDPTTDQLFRLRSFLLAGKVFDVIDLDGYGGPERMLMSGAVSLLAATGYLFVTYPIKGAARMFPNPLSVSIGAHGRRPSGLDLLSLVVSTSMAWGYKAEIECTESYDAVVLRLAFKCTKFRGLRTTMEAVLDAEHNMRRLSV